MGLDARIDFAFSGSDAELNNLAYDLGRRTRSDFYCEHPCLKRSDDTPDVVEVRTWSRMWSHGYERGHWPDIRACLSVLFVFQNDGRISGLRYYGDSLLRDEVEDFIPEALADLDTHFARGHWGYRWGERSMLLYHEPDPGTPTDTYGKRMRRNGWGARFAAYYSHADGTSREWRNGEWVR